MRTLRYAMMPTTDAAIARCGLSPLLREMIVRDTEAAAVRRAETAGHGIASLWLSCTAAIAAVQLPDAAQSGGCGRWPALLARRAISARSGMGAGRHASERTAGVPRDDRPLSFGVEQRAACSSMGRLGKAGAPDQLDARPRLRQWSAPSAHVPPRAGACPALSGQPHRTSPV